MREEARSGADEPVRRVVIVGGGTAGWLAACLIAARAVPTAGEPLSVTLIESPDVPTIGVGEGTWPTMRGTLAAIGIGESEFLAACDGAFKQGTRFDGWTTGAADDIYYHPFTAAGADAWDLVEAWRSTGFASPFAKVASAQPAICARDLAPRQRSMPGYAGALNYAYHLDAAKFGALLSEHATRRLGVTRLCDHVVSVEAGDEGAIRAVVGREAGPIAGDLFIDCTGHAALLIGEHCGVGLVDRGDALFNDRALAVQVPSAPDRPIASQTIASAHEAGWIWDIGLPARRGIGCVYSSAHLDEAGAERVLRGYLERSGAAAPSDHAIRALSFRSAHRERFWHGNCIAVGQSAGFLEPLEASAIVMVELSLGALLADFPRTHGAMAARARRFDALFRYRWDRIVEFLKLHYVLSRRDEPYWRAHRDPATVAPRLAELLELWRDRPPLPADFSAVDEVFPAASYQYVLYGMGFAPPPPPPVATGSPAAAGKLAHAAAQRARALLAALPSNRAYFDAIEGAHQPLPEPASP